MDLLAKSTCSLSLAELSLVPDCLALPDLAGNAGINAYSASGRSPLLINCCSRPSA
jgi:hypothetical protein